MKSMSPRSCRSVWFVVAIGVWLSPAATTCSAAEAEIRVLPTYRRSIRGVSKLERSTYFALSDPGRDFDQRVRDPRRMRYVLEELDASFGRQLGPVNAVVRWSKGVREDAARPGHVDLERLAAVLDAERKPPNEALKRLTDGRLEIASHGSVGAFPDFMGEYTTPQAQEGDHPQVLPEDLDAAAELSVAVMRHGFNNFDRPRFYELINEPHWSFVGDQKLAEWHVKTREAMRRESVDVQVGGPCLSVAYFYKREFDAFNGLRDFIKHTRGELDFYSFHVYDYLRWNGSGLAGRVTSGLPLEGVLDLVQSHMVQEYDRETPIVISECGAYITTGEGRPGSQQFGDRLVGPGSGFEHTMRKRSIDYHVFVSAAIANALTFMDHPHVVKKAVPFTLLESTGWDPKYTSVLYTPRDFQKGGEWVETGAADFYRFFRGLEGERAVVRCDDPDVQTRAFVQGKRLWIAVNNLSDVPHTTRLKVPRPERVTLRRYRRNDDFTASLTEGPTDSLETLELAGREAVMILADYSQAIRERGVIEETPHYGHAIRQKPEGNKPAKFWVKTPDLGDAAYATLRVAVSRPVDASPEVVVKLNGKRLEVPGEETAPRLASDDEYASTKLIPVPRSLMKARNRVEVSFADGKRGMVGSVVLRVGRKQGA